MLFIEITYTASSRIDPTHIVGFSASTLETSTAVICACGPGMKPVFKRFFPRFLSSSQYITPQHTSYERTRLSGNGPGNTTPGLSRHTIFSKSEEDIFELTGSGRIANHINIADRLDANAVAKKLNAGGSSFIESDEEQVTTNLNIVRTFDVSINYQTEHGRQVTRHATGDGKAASMDSLV